MAGAHWLTYSDNIIANVGGLKSVFNLSLILAVKCPEQRNKFGALLPYRVLLLHGQTSSPIFIFLPFWSLPPIGE